MGEDELFSIKTERERAQNESVKNQLLTLQLRLRFWKKEKKNNVRNIDDEHVDG